MKLPRGFQVGLKMGLFSLAGASSLERAGRPLGFKPTSLTSEKITPHFPSDPRSTRKQISKVSFLLIPLVMMPFVTDVTSAPNPAVSFPRRSLLRSQRLPLEFGILKFRNYLLPFIHNTIVPLPPLRHHHSRKLVVTVSETKFFLPPLLYHHSRLLGFTVSNPGMSLPEKGIF
ncbi:hypothetical protein ACB098_08G053900 [Castanea mollissima]